MTTEPQAVKCAAEHCRNCFMGKPGQFCDGCEKVIVTALKAQKKD